VFPLGHAAFGYLLYTVFAWVTRHRLPYGLTLVALLVGTQFPDIVDKPLAYAGVLPGGRSLGHSLLVAAVLVTLLWLLARRYGHAHLLVAFGFGHISHILGDVIRTDFGSATEVGRLTFLLWPLLPAPEYSVDSVPPWIRIIRYYRSPDITPGLVLIPVVLITFVVIELQRRRVAPK
jgi:membrane-bound metal-dependent hydrolase YbcI (DUF457 family)